MRIRVVSRRHWMITQLQPIAHASVIAATRDLSRTLVYAVGPTDAKGDGLPLAQRFGYPAFSR
ncbi:hypothetical protein [Streptomyces sp. SID486]|uniref:hypothetical protein n=1 Tax=Streptomyces sp. SID486 TaxID=2690264 RepID=UPI001F24E6A2|nr:hypothetical protein [Streptomyces sp. SID486]